jgi:hypothetical protein
MPLVLRDHWSRQHEHAAVRRALPGSRVSGGAFILDQYIKECYKKSPVGGDKCSRCGRRVNEVDDGIDVGDGMMYGVEPGVSLVLLYYWIEG